MTFLSTVLALALMPLWIFSLGPSLTPDTLTIPFTQLVFSLLGSVTVLMFYASISINLNASPTIISALMVFPFTELYENEMTIFAYRLILPTALGMWMRWRWPKLGNLMKKIIVPFTLFTVLFILTVGIYINLFIFLLITPLMVLAGFMVAIAGYLFGAGLARLLNLSLAQIIAVSIETSFQNGGIAFILLKIRCMEL